MITTDPASEQDYVDRQATNLEIRCPDGRVIRTIEQDILLKFVGDLKKLLKEIYPPVTISDWKGIE